MLSTTTGLAEKDEADKALAASPVSAFDDWLKLPLSPPTMQFIAQWQADHARRRSLLQGVGNAAAKLIQTVSVLLADGYPAPVATVANAAVRQELQAELAKLGHALDDVGSMPVPTALELSPAVITDKPRA